MFIAYTICIVCVKCRITEHHALNLTFLIYQITFFGYFTIPHTFISFIFLTFHVIHCRDGRLIFHANPNEVSDVLEVMNEIIIYKWNNLFLSQTKISLKHPIISFDL